jgi:hypothetical protein
MTRAQEGIMVVLVASMGFWNDLVKLILKLLNG